MITLDQFTTFAKTAINGPSGVDSTISIGQDGKSLNVGRWHRLGTRTGEFKANNLDVRTQFFKTIADTFGGVDKIPPSVKDVMKMKDFKLDREGKVTSQRPLTARRILAITEAIRRTAPEAIAAGLVRPGNAKDMVRLGAAENKAVKAMGFASTEALKSYVTQKFETYYSTARQSNTRDIRNYSGNAYMSAITGISALIDIFNQRLGEVDSVLCRELFDTMLYGTFSAQFPNSTGRINAKDNMESFMIGQLDMIEETIGPRDDGFVNEFERVMKEISPDHADTFEGIVQAYNNMVDLLAATGAGGISNYTQARFQGMLVRPAVIHCNPNNKDYTITLDDLAKNTPFAAPDTLEKWHNAGLGEDATSINFNTGVGSLANDLPRAVNGDFFFTIGTGDEAIKVGGKVTRHAGQQTIDESLQVSKRVLNAIKAKFPKSTEMQQNVVMQALSQNSLSWARTFLYPGAEHAAGDFKVEEVPGTGDIKVSFKAKEIKNEEVVQNYRHAYVIHPDGTGEMAEFERKMAKI